MKNHFGIHKFQSPIIGKAQVIHREVFVELANVWFQLIFARGLEERSSFFFYTYD